MPNFSVIFVKALRKNLSYFIAPGEGDQVKAADMVFACPKALQVFNPY